MVAETDHLNCNYPFCAVVGQNQIKMALLCALVDPNITSVLIVGTAGTAKTTIVRSLAEICPSAKVITLPLNIAEERLIGGMDIEAAINEGKKVRDPGILEKANGNILLMDQVNLFDENIVQIALATAEIGYFLMEREGMASQIDSKFLLIGTMDPREGGLPSHILDRFEVCTFMDDIDNPEERVEIIRKRVDFELDRLNFHNSYQQETETLRLSIEMAHDRHPYVMCSEGHLETISRLCLELGVEGHRGDIAMTKVTKCIAALNQRDNVITDDLQKAAEICLQHRRKDPPKSNDSRCNEPKEQAERSDASPETSNDDHEYQKSSDDHPIQQIEGDDVTISEGRKQHEVLSIGDPFTIIQFLKDDDRLKMEKKKRGRRGTVISPDRSGRYVSFRLPNGKLRDIAFDATIRAAAPFQRSRKKGNRSFVIESSDLREKVRVRKNGTTILFLVDASGSMGVKRRMITVKGAILSMLKDAYQKRDVVGLMTFSNESSLMILPPTKSIDLAYTKLRTIPTGGRTPLPLALSKATEFLCSPKMRDADVALVIVTDGRANVAVQEGNAFSQALRIAQQMSALPIKYVVVDSETGYPRMGKASKLCEALGGSYFKLEGLNADEMASSLNIVMHGAMKA